MKRKAGFTLTEVLIVIAIVAILTAIALPSYNNQMRKTRRSDAMTALTHAASMQERFYMRNNSYSGNVNDLGGSGGAMSSPEGFYDIAVDNTGCPNGQPDGSCYVLSATPVAGGPQVQDTHCAVFSLADTGQKSAADDGGTTQSDCW